MAFLSSDVPFQPQQTNIAGALQGPAVPAFQGGVFGQQQLADLLQSLSAGPYAGGTGGAADIEALLRQMGPQIAGTGTNALQQALQAEQQAQQIETTGTLPAGGQALIQRNLEEQTAAIKGKYAQIGQSGSTAELDELNRAQSNNLINQFTIAGNLGQILGQQGQVLGQLGLGQLGQGLSTLTTSGSLGTTLAQLGLSGLSLTQDDYARLATEGASALNIESGIYGDQAKLQLASDAQLTNTLGGFFKAFAGNSGAFGSEGFIPGLQSMFGGGSAAALAGAPPGIEADLAFAALA